MQAARLRDAVRRAWLGLGAAVSVHLSRNALARLYPTLQAVGEAVAAGELDTLLMAAKKERGRPKRKAAA